MVFYSFKVIFCMPSLILTCKLTFTQTMSLSWERALVLITQVKLIMGARLQLHLGPEWLLNWMNKLEYSLSNFK